MDVQADTGWWRASDGYWYPPEARPDAPWHGPARGPHGEDPPGPGWWLASDYQWYPPDAKPGEVWAEPVAVVPGQPVSTRPALPTSPYASLRPVAPPAPPSAVSYAYRAQQPAGEAPAAAPERPGPVTTVDSSTEAAVGVIKGLVLVVLGMLIVAVSENLSGEWSKLAFVAWLPIIGGFAYSAFSALAFSKSWSRR